MRLGRVASQSSRPVGPVSVKGTFVTDDFGMTTDFDAVVFPEGVVTIAKLNPSVLVSPIAVIFPAPSFLGMTEVSPF